MLAIAQGEQNPVFLLWANYLLGFTLADQGEFVSARTHLEQSLALYDSGQRHFQNFVQDPGVTGLAMLALVLFDLGYPERALQRGREALALGRKLSHPYSLAFALGWLGLLHAERGEYSISQQLEEEMIALSNQHGFVLLTALGTIWRGRAMVEQGVKGEGIAAIRRSLATFTDERSGEERTFSVFLLAVAYGKLGQFREGLALLAELLTVVNELGKRSLESDVYRLKGELLLMQDTANQLESEQCFRMAISIARRQEARSYELRATTRPARLLIGQGKRDEARTMLDEIYGWFTEGLDTADLKDAKVLLDELTS
jgi:adenylate cyclase